MNNTINIGKIKSAIRDFTNERDWEQFHSPKNISCALNVETSELLEIFQWVKEDDSKKIMENPQTAQKVREELADIFYYLMRFSDLLEIDIETEFWNKMKKNAEKYPVDLAKGNSKKYTELK